MKIKLSLEEKAELEWRHAHEQEVGTKDRLKIILLFSEGWGLTQIAQALRISSADVQDHLNNFICNHHLPAHQQGDLHQPNIIKENNTQVPTDPLLDKVLTSQNGEREISSHTNSISSDSDIDNKTELNESFLENIAKNIHATVWLASPNISEVYYMSPNFKAIYDITFDEFQKNPEEFQKRIHPEDLPKWKEAFSLPQAIEHTKLSFRYLKNDGMWHYLTAYRSFIFDDKQTPLQVAGVTIDNTELYNAKEKILAQKEELSFKNMELGKANESLENFTIIACHDLAQPLRIVKAIIEIFKSSHSIKEGKSGNDLLIPLEKAVTRMKETIDEISRIALEGGRKTSTEHLNVEKLLKEKVEPLLLAEFPTTIIRNSPLQPLNTNKELIFLLFKNIIENGIKYNDNIPIIKIRSKKFRLGIAYSIADNGIGIPEDSQKEIFKPGMRLNKKTGAQGLGIGLAGCEKMMSLYNGKIWVHSKAGQGSTFYLFFPSNGNKSSKYDSSLPKKDLMPSAPKKINKNPTLKYGNALQMRTRSKA